jgi:hypothetical protein
MEIREITAGYQNLNQNVTRFIFGKHIQLDKNKLNLNLPQNSIGLFGEIGFADVVIATRQVPKKFSSNNNFIHNSKIITTFTVGIIGLTQNYKNQNTLNKLTDFFIQKANSLNLNTIIITTNNSVFLIENLPKLGYFLFGNKQYAIKTF